MQSTKKRALEAKQSKKGHNLRTPPASVPAQPISSSADTTSLKVYPAYVNLGYSKCTAFHEKRMLFQHKLCISLPRCKLDFKLYGERDLENHVGQVPLQVSTRSKTTRLPLQTLQEHIPIQIFDSEDEGEL